MRHRLLAALAAAAFVVSTQAVVAAARPEPLPTPHQVAPEDDRPVPSDPSTLHLSAVEYVAIARLVDAAHAKPTQVLAWTFDPGDKLTAIEPQQLCSP